MNNALSGVYGVYICKDVNLPIVFLIDMQVGPGILNALQTFVLLSATPLKIHKL